MEEWRPIAGFNERYFISSFGRVKSLVGKTERILKPYDNGKGYQIVILRHEQKNHHKAIHRLVGETFLVKIEDKPQIDHINHLRHDNRVCNLRWVNSSEQNRNKVYKPNKLNQRYIYQSSPNTFEVRFSFTSLEEAILFRDKALSQKTADESSDNDILASN